MALYGRKVRDNEACTFMLHGARSNSQSLYRPTPSSLGPRTVGPRSGNQYTGGFYRLGVKVIITDRLHEGQKLISFGFGIQTQSSGAGAIGQVPLFVLGPVRISIPPNDHQTREAGLLNTLSL